VPKLSKHKTVRDALLFVARNPQWPDVPMLDMPVWELASRKLYEMAVSPDARVIGSLARSTRAQKIILNRTTGTRRAGTHPAQQADESVNFHDLGTKGVTGG
jgi:hypothetical protein